MKGIFKALSTILMEQPQLGLGLAIVVGLIISVHMNFKRHFAYVVDVLVSVCGLLLFFYMRGSLNELVWTKPLSVLAVAILMGIAMVFSLRRSERDEEAVERASLAQDLQGRRNEALEALAILEDQQHLMAPDDYTRERKALLSKGAMAIRELDALTGVVAEGAPAPAAAAIDADDATAVAIEQLTAALGRGEIDASTYATSVNALK